MTRKRRRGRLRDSHGLDLTTAAASALQEHLDSTRLRILREVERVRMQAARGTQVREDEVTSAIQRLAIADARVYYWGMIRRGAELLLPAFLVLGTIAPTTVGIAFLLKGGGDNPSTGWLAVAVGAIVASFATMTVSVVRTLNVRRRGRRRYAAQEFLRRMVQLETEARTFAKVTSSSDSVEDVGLSGILVALVEREVWSPEDVAIFRALLRLRNALVHEQIAGLPTEELLHDALGEGERLRDLIRDGFKHHRLNVRTNPTLANS
ncbi:hypothetical protein WEI85_34870 [Actinomycetes bacterium KLBMP 9797]